jgi:hypothetical protein
MVALRAICSIQPASAWRVMPPKYTRRVVVRKNNSALRISTIRAIGSDVKSTLRVGRIAEVTSVDPQGNNVMHLSATRWFYRERIYCGAQAVIYDEQPRVLCPHVGGRTVQLIHYRQHLLGVERLKAIPNGMYDFSIC